MSLRHSPDGGILTITAQKSPATTPYYLMASLSSSLWLLSYTIQLLWLVLTYHAFEHKARCSSKVITEQASRIAKLKAEVLELSVKEEDAREAVTEAREHNMALRRALERKQIREVDARVNRQRVIQAVERTVTGSRENANSHPRQEYSLKYDEPGTDKTRAVT
jgi:hypothetical protein